MSDSAGGGESGGVAGAGQDAEADNEPPHLEPPLPEGDVKVEVGETSEEGVPSSAKRPRMSDEEEVVKPVEMHGVTPAQEDPASPAQSRVYALNMLN